MSKIRLLTRWLDRRTLAQNRRHPAVLQSTTLSRCLLAWAAVCGYRRCQKCSPQATRQRSLAVIRTALAGLRGPPSAGCRCARCRTRRSRSLRSSGAGRHRLRSGKRETGSVAQFRETGSVVSDDFNTFFDFLSRGALVRGDALRASISAMLVCRPDLSATRSTEWATGGNRRFPVGLDRQGGAYAKLVRSRPLVPGALV